MTSPLLNTPVYQGQRIGLFGGSFNPAHEGHLAVSNAAMNRLDLDWVWWLISPQNPLKNPSETSDFRQRMKIAQRFTHHPRLKVTGLEHSLATRTTLQTLKVMAPLLKRARFVWIMGADSFSQLHLWNNWQEIPQILPLAVFDRPGWTKKALASPAAFKLRAHRLPFAQASRLAGSRCPAWSFISMPQRHENSTLLRTGQKPK